MTIENRLSPHALFDTNVQLGSDDVISLTVTPDEAFVSVTTRRRGGDAVPADIFQGRTRQIVLTSLTGHRTARIADALALAATVDLDTYTAAIVTGFHDGVSGDRGDAIAAVEDIEHALYGLVGNEDIDFATNSGVSVWSADEWLQACDELEFLGKTDDAIIAEAECENIILLDVAEWREEATARRLPEGEPCWLCVESAEQVGDPLPATVVRVCTNNSEAERPHWLCDQCAWIVDDNTRNAALDAEDAAAQIAQG